MNRPDKPARPDPDASDDDDAAPASGAEKGTPQGQPRSDQRTPDKEGGAPVDELDLDGDGARRQ